MENYKKEDVIQKQEAIKNLLEAKKTFSSYHSVFLLKAGKILSEQDYKQIVGNGDSYYVEYDNSFIDYLEDYLKYLQYLEIHGYIMDTSQNPNIQADEIFSIDLTPEAKVLMDQVQKNGVIYGEQQAKYFNFLNREKH